MTPLEYAELLKFIYENHGWYAMFGLNKRSEDGNKFIKYIDCNFDTRDGQIWRIVLRRGNETFEFKGDNLKEQVYEWLNNK